VLQAAGPRSQHGGDRREIAFRPHVGDPGIRARWRAERAVGSRVARPAGSGEGGARVALCRLAVAAAPFLKRVERRAESLVLLVGVEDERRRRLGLKRQPVAHVGAQRVHVGGAAVTAVD